MAYESEHFGSFLHSEYMHLALHYPRGIPMYRVFIEVVTGSIIPSDDILVVSSLIQLGWTDFVFVSSLKTIKEIVFHWLEVALSHMI